jgi:hypothetical protein
VFEHVKQRPARLLGGSAYGSAEMLGWLVYDHRVTPNIGHSSAY